MKLRVDTDKNNNKMRSLLVSSSSRHYYRRTTVLSYFKAGFLLLWFFVVLASSTGSSNHNSIGRSWSRFDYYNFGPKQPPSYDLVPDDSTIVVPLRRRQRRRLRAGRRKNSKKRHYWRQQQQRNRCPSRIVWGLNKDRLLSRNQAAQWLHVPPEEPTANQVRLGILPSFNHPYYGMTHPQIHAVQKQNHDSSHSSWFHSSSEQSASTASYAVPTSSSPNTSGGLRRNAPSSAAFSKSPMTTRELDEKESRAAVTTKVTTRETSSSSSQQQEGRPLDGLLGVDSNKKDRSSNNNNMKMWFPPTAISPPAYWRKLCYRQHVGQGMECYEACRDAALAWEFHTTSKGMVLAQQQQQQMSSSSTTTHRHYKGRVEGGIEKHHPPQETRPWMRMLASSEEEMAVAQGNSSNSNNNNSILPRYQSIWSGPGRRYVTYTKLLGLRRLGGFLYNINPVTVVYDCVDQQQQQQDRSRGGDGGGTVLFTSTAYATNRGHWLCGEERVTVSYHLPTQSCGIEILSYSTFNPHSLLGRCVWPLIGRLQHSFFQQQMQHFQTVARQAQQQ